MWWKSLERKDCGGLLNRNDPLLNMGEHFGEASLHACPVLIHFSQHAGRGRRWGDGLDLVCTAQLPF